MLCARTHERLDGVGQLGLLGDHLAPHQLVLEAVQLLLLGARLLDELPLGVRLARLALKVGQQLLGGDHGALHALDVGLDQLVLLRELRQLRAAQKEAVLVLGLRAAEKLARSVLRQNVHRVVDLDVGVVADRIEFLALRRHRLAVRAANLPRTVAVRVDAPLHRDGVAHLGRGHDHRIGALGRHEGAHGLLIDRKSVV